MSPTVRGGRSVVAGGIWEGNWILRDAAKVPTNAPSHEAVMSGHGFYNRHSVLQAAAAAYGLETLRAAAGEVPLPETPQPLVAADFGCSQGQNSLQPMGDAVAAVRDRTDAAVTVVHTDLPSNDFSEVFELLAHDARSYLRSHRDTYALAAGRSFYEEILPPGSVTLGWSSVTTHWLSTVPAPVPGHLAAQNSDDEGLRLLFADRAAADWQGFLSARAAELVPGGRLVMVEPCAHPDGHIGSEGLQQLMDQVLGEFVGSGRITSESAAAATLPMWMRTPDEYLDPVEAHPDLEVRSSQVIEGLKSPLWAQFETGGDGAAYAAASIGAMRAWSEAMIAEAIPEPATLDAYYERCRVLGAEDPDRLHLEVFHIVMDIARI